MKFDKDKIRWSLLPLASVEEVVKVLEFGAKKYGADNWRSVNPERYRDAMMRHLMAVWIGQEEIDPESGFPHYAHAMCNLLFLSVLEKKDITDFHYNVGPTLVYTPQINPVYKEAV
jgi:hypothetical protein